MTSILDEMYAFNAAHITATDTQLDAMTLYAAATHAMKAHVTFGRMLFTSDKEESGKTLAMQVTASLCSAPSDAAGTKFALDSELAQAANEPERPVPTLYYDEVSNVFGRSGTGGNSSPLADILRRGYKRGATSKRSTNRVAEEYSVFTGFLMTGLKVAVPRDIRSRCIVIRMEPGKPRRYFDARESEPEARVLGVAVAHVVKEALPAIRAFRARGIHPKLVARKLEVWEPLFAVAHTLGGQEWLNRCLSAFLELALDESDQPVLSFRQQVLSDLILAMAKLDAGLPGEPAKPLSFYGGLELADELMRFERPMYEGRSAHSIVCAIRDAMPVPSRKVRVNGTRMNGYTRTSILDAWDAVRPADSEDAVIPEETDPFAIDGPDSDYEDLFPGPDGPDAGLDGLFENAASPASGPGGPDGPDSFDQLAHAATEV